MKRLNKYKAFWIIGLILLATLATAQQGLLKFDGSTQEDLERCKKASPMCAENVQNVWDEVA